MELAHWRIAANSDGRTCSDMCINASERLPRRSRLSLRANDSILSPMFAPITAESKGEPDICYLPFDLQVSQQREGWRDTANMRPTYIKPATAVQSYISTNFRYTTSIAAEAIAQCQRHLVRYFF